MLTEPFKFLPKFCLAAIVISSVTNLIDYPEVVTSATSSMCPTRVAFMMKIWSQALHLWKIKKPDFVLWMLAFFGTLFLGVQNGMDANAARHVEPTLMYCLTSQDYWSPWVHLWSSSSMRASDHRSLFSGGYQRRPSIEVSSRLACVNPTNPRCYTSLVDRIPSPLAHPRFLRRVSASSSLAS